MTNHQAKLFTREFLEVRAFLCSLWHQAAACLYVALASLILVPLFPHYSAGLRSDEEHTIHIFEQVSPSVVYITTIALQEDFFSRTVFEVPQGTGSGAIWNAEGYIITNYHVIEGAATGRGSSIKVTLDDRSTHVAKLVGFEVSKDLAVLKITPPEKSLRPIEIGGSSPLKIGQNTMAIGTPFGLDRTLTTGIVSGLGRKIPSATGQTIEGMIQTDAAINPGNSGGPLLESSGHMIGMNTAIVSPSGAYAGIGFAVPVDIITRLVPQIIKYGKARKPSLGISLLDDYYAKRIGIPGVVIYEVEPKGPADKAGLTPIKLNKYGEMQLGDIISAVDDVKITVASDLLDIIDRHEVGDILTLSVLRGTKKTKIKLTLGSNV
jgi:S1-C subfamily serine protease